MNHVMMPVPGDLVSDDPEATELLYQPMVLENALNRALDHYREDHEEPLAAPMDSLPSSLQMFRCFVDKLALVCDSNRGGQTVTAIAILQGRDCAVYVLASNSRAVSEQKEVEEFLTKLLHFIHQNPHELERKALTKKVLWHMILFNRDRVKAYLKNLPRYLHGCIADCQRREQSKLVQELQGELRMLSSKAGFTHETNSDNERHKFLSDCESLLKAIHAFKENRFDRIALMQSTCPKKRDQELWCELRHCLGRLLSYRQAAEAVVATNEWWPQLFHDFIIHSVRPSRKMGKPILNNSLSAASIVKNMTEDDEDLEDYLENAAVLQAIGLDNQIRQQLTTKTFRPIVHAEVQIHSLLIRKGISHPRKFWNGYKYIGSSKPTCRLCSYYFHNHWDNIATRPSHGNLYLNWRLPDLYQSGQSSEIRKRRELLARMTEHVRNDAKRTLQEGLPSRRKHDSSDNSRVPRLFASSIGGSSSILSDVPSNFLGPHLPTQENRVDSDERPIYEDLSDILEDSGSEYEEDGASLTLV